jgi:hypothetical protein
MTLENKRVCISWNCTNDEGDDYKKRQTQDDHSNLLSIFILTFFCATLVIQGKSIVLGLRIKIRKPLKDKLLLQGLSSGHFTSGKYPHSHTSLFC